MARAALMAAWTSRAALLISRSISNINVTRLDPSELRERISLIPEIEPRACSNGVATLEAMVCGLAPANCADTEIMGKSTCGKGATGKKIYARSEEHTSELQSRGHLVCRLLLEK